MKTRNLDSKNPEQASESGWIVDAGDPCLWECVSKSHNDALRMMKSTKRMRVDGGWIYCVTTEKGEQIAEALVFVPRPSSENHDKLIAALREAQGTLELILDDGPGWQRSELGQEWAKRDALLRELDGEGT